MLESELNSLLKELRSWPNETEWLEFKVNQQDPNDIGEYISAISNAAKLFRKDKGYIVWGVNDKTHNIIGTNFKPHQEKVGAEELEHWLIRLLTPRLDFRIYEFLSDDKPAVIFEVPAANYMPTRFKEEEYIRIGSNKKKLKDFPEKERALWALFRNETFEKNIAASDIRFEDIFELIDTAKLYEMCKLGQPLESWRVIERLEKEQFIVNIGEGLYDITNIGALLFAKRLDNFQNLARKTLRIVFYKGTNRTEAVKEYERHKGYAVDLEDIMEYLDTVLPRNEEMGRTLRTNVCMYPIIALRELIVNALIHQDFSLAGTGPIVEVFSDRVEITNPGIPLIDTLRFIDEPPRSRNEQLASTMRRLNFCEERGSGIDKVIFQVEFYQLPAPDFLVTANHTRIILYAARPLAKMSQGDRIRACYQHACLCYVSGREMTNSTLRKRFGIDPKNRAIASRIIYETIESELIKPLKQGSKSRKYAKYVPYWL
jgi:predicted HTH transcriptional regulator